MMKISRSAELLGGIALAVAALVGLQQPAEAQTAFTAGNLVVYRVGDGSAALTGSSTAVFLDEYTPTGTLVRSIAVPTTTGGGSFALTASGTATSEGMLNLSSNGQYLAISGYNTGVGTSNVGTSNATTISRTVSIFDSTGAIRSSTALTDLASGSSVRSAVSTDDGTAFYATGGAGGVRYATVGATTSTQLSTTVTNLRNVNITAGQLYVSDSSGTSVRLGTVGTGTPTTAGQTITNLPGFPTTGSPYQFAFADLSSSVAGVDTLYVADDAAGIQKYSLVGGNWVLNNTIAVTNINLRGLTLSVTGTTVNLYSTTPTNIYALTDTSGYNANDNGTLASIASVSTNEAFRGLAFAPSLAVVPEPATVLGGFLLVGALGCNQRRRLGGLAGLLRKTRAA